MYPRAAVACLSLALLLACGRGTAPAPEVDPAARRSLAGGEVVGFVGRYGSHVWLGVPFARPPVGELRWRAPRPPEPWSGVREALAAGSACPQFESPLGSGAVPPGTFLGSEDCLYLNVYAPRFAADAVPKGDARLPVMFWIHGGGNTIGEAAFYDGGRLAASENVIVVATNYRLGPLGWFHHPSIFAPDADAFDRSGNYGTLDLVRALEWVRENVAAFGGDPGRVTIFGESAGGRNVVSLLLAPAAAGLFHRAIVQSGGVDLASIAEAHAGDPERGPGGSTGSDFVVDALGGALREKSAEELLRAYPGDKGMGMFSLPTLIRDGAVLPDADPRERFARGDYHRVPIVLGTNRDEAKIFLIGDPALVRRWFGLFPRLRVPEERYEVISEYAAKAWKARSVDTIAPLLVSAQGESVYAYRFDWDEEPDLLFSDLSVLLGAAHLLEVPFVFGHWELGPTLTPIFTGGNEAGREALSAKMRSYWAQFAYTGDPGRGRTGDLPEWAPWDESAPESPKFAVLDTDADGGVRMSSEVYDKERLRAEVLADPRLPGWPERCEQLRGLATHSGFYTRADYAAEPQCRDVGVASAAAGG